MYKKNSGFTLIELLTVLAIMGILASLLIVGIGTVRQKANTAASSSNLRQLGQGILLYVSDKGRYPPGFNDIPGTQEQQALTNHWESLITEYYPNKTLPEDILYHPGDVVDRGIQIPDAYPRTYSMVRGEGNVGIGISASEDGKATQGRRLDEVESPATTLLLTERPTAGNLAGSVVDAVLNSPEQQMEHQPDLNGSSGGFNYLFVDGHVEFLDPLDTVGDNGTLANPEGYWTVSTTD